VITNFDFPSFSSVSLDNFFKLTRINDNSPSVLGTSVLLTSAKVAAGGALWTRGRQSVGNGFDTTFKFRFTGKGPPGGLEDGGDGIVFVIHNDSRGMDAIGELGCSLGYGGTTNAMKLVVAVEIDTYQNAPNEPMPCSIGDPSTQSISIQSSQWVDGKYIGSPNLVYNASMGLPISGVNRNFDDGNAYQIRIIYVAPTRRETNNSDLLSICPLNGLSLSGENGMLCIFLKRFDEINYSLILQRQIKDLYGLTDLNGRAYVGFTASTGTTYQNQLIESWKFTSIPIYRDTVGVYRPSEGRFYLYPNNSSAGNAVSFNFGNPIPPGTVGCFGDTNGPYWPLAGDWDGDGLDSIGLYNCSTGFFYLRNSNTTGEADHTFLFGIPGDLPIGGRWQNEAVTDGIGVFRWSNGLVFLRNTPNSGASDFSLVFGNPGDLPIAGNWDGINSDSIGIYRPGQLVSPADEPSTTNFNWSLTDSLSGGVSTPVAFGSPGGLPIAGDWTTRYQSGIGLYNPSTGYVELKNDPSYSSGANIAYALGVGGDRPVAGRWSNAPFLPITTCPWNGSPSYTQGTLTTCTYTYNRNDAFNYATKWSQKANPIFCRYTYPGIGPPCFSNPTPPGKIDPPTNCTNFTSQVLLAGGLPMTDSNEAYSVWRAFADGLNRVVGKGETWNGAYYNGYPKYIATSIPGATLSADSIVMSTQIPGIYTYPDYGTSALTAQPTLVSVCNSLWNSYNIQRGDLIYLDITTVNDPRGRAHMVLVAGWGPFISEWSQLNTPALYTTRPEAVNANVQSPVIYIIDHGPGGEYNSGGTGPYAQPRPYYTLWWRVIQSDDKSALSNIGFRVIHLPNTVIIPVNKTPIPTRFYYPVTPPFQKTQLYLGITLTPKQ
jgi:hypothetical protein